MKRKYRNLLENTTLRTRLLIPFLALMTIAILAVGLTSYFQAKNMTLNSIQDRLIREVELMSDIVELLHFTYISDEAYFWQQFNINIRSQQETLKTDGIESEFFYIVDNQVTPFPVSEESLPEIPDRLVETITAAEDGQIEETLNGKEHTISYQKMDEIDGIYVLLVPNDSFMGPINNMGTLTIAIILISIVVSTILIILFVRMLIKPLNSLRNAMKEVRKGNLKHTEEIKTTIPEFVSLHKSYNAMMNHMKTMIHELKHTTIELDETGDHLKQSSEDAIQSSEDLIESINVVKLGAEQTANSSENSVSNSLSMKNQIEDMIHNMELVFSSSDNMGKSAILGEKNIQSLIETIRSFEKDFDHLTGTIKQINEHSFSISKLVGLIQGIAEQTKLLSLNASIEAARAGDAGRGFSVVANEVGKLAEQSSEAAKEITESISNMEGITQNATEEFEQMLEKTNTNISMANESKQTFDGLMKGITDVSSNLKGMHGILQHLEDILPDLEKVSEEVASVSQETLASTEEMLASSEHQHQQTERTHEIGLKLTELSKSLSKITSKFTI
ncbi:methyl-accepting chemotaxis protein [Oceanobacillus salinisoli]|uniref:methyl-accepting chemotaxis protein n=1 Tax=Oceanobacillus salinisoli TaxID=2678611 RepID=UPI0012E1A79D|nr:methyl-accepting chemotaxis protein [Oceanobacillus salinisoli]